MGRLTRALAAALKRDRNEMWPRPEAPSMDEPHFFFVITPPYSGSTALARVLNTARGTALLHRTGEGQWLVPGMCAEDRWDPDKVMNWDSIRATWLHRVAEMRALATVDVVIEKSPPNLVRVDQLIETFPNHSLMAFNRDPFAHCSSVLYRHADPANKSAAERVQAVEVVAHGWLARSRLLRRWIEELDALHFSYEQFCADPATYVETLGELAPALKTADASSGIQVKDYEKQELENQNARQIALLRPPEIDAIATVLRTQPALVDYFGYAASG